MTYPYQSPGPEIRNLRRNATFVDQREADQARAVVRCLLMAAAVVCVGALGFRLIEGWSLWDSTYFTLVTISTVGYGDYGLSEDGRKFCAVLLLCGIGTFTYSLSTVMHIAADVDAAMRRKMKREIAACDGHVIVCGYGRIGQMICDEIEAGGLRAVVIEQASDAAQRAVNDGRLIVVGPASDDDVLIAAGIKRAVAVVCAVDSDGENLFITVSARELNPECRVISRAESPSAARKLERAGASLVVSPHQMAGKTIATALVQPRLTRFLAGGTRDEAGEDGLSFELGEAVVAGGSAIAGRTVREVGQELRGVVFVAIERPDGQVVVQPPGDEVFEAGDVVIFAASGAQVERMRTVAARPVNAEPALV